MKATVNTERCTGCGICEIVCPEVFRMTGHEHKSFAVVRSEIVPEAALNFCRDARDCCKPRAILVSESPPVATAPYAHVYSVTSWR